MVLLKMTLRKQQHHRYGPCFLFFFEGLPQEKQSKRRLAVKFLNKLAEKEKLKASPLTSHAMRLTPRLRKKKERAPLIGDTLLRKFVLDSGTFYLYASMDDCCFSRGDI